MFTPARGVVVEVVGVDLDRRAVTSPRVFALVVVAALVVAGVVVGAVGIAAAVGAAGVASSGRV